MRNIAGVSNYISIRYDEMHPLKYGTLHNIQSCCQNIPGCPSMIINNILAFNMSGERESRTTISKKYTTLGE